MRKRRTARPTRRCVSISKTKKIRYAGDPEIKDVPEGYRDPKFAFAKGDTVAILGNGLADRMQHDGWTETLLQDQHRDLGLKFRNLSLTGDRVDKYPRSRASRRTRNT